ncbi:PREDICTED: unconventional myosin-XVIIIa-like, partial [Pterocles gutturalis]|uniref:unconventional myosin-XVIIIa-like n=1 Tax=Pterocles gutturalis TaxID=240206 RepID=UPI000528DC29
MLDHLKNNAPSKREIAQLKNQLEESEFTCAAAVKARKSMEVEIEDLHLQIDDLTKAKAALEEQLPAAAGEERGAEPAGGGPGGHERADEEAQGGCRPGIPRPGADERPAGAAGGGQQGEAGAAGE